MISIIEPKDEMELLPALKQWLQNDEHRLGLITSLDGKQLVTLLLDLASRQAKCWITEFAGDSYRSFTSSVPQAHWFERALFDMYGLLPKGHPRLKPALLNEAYSGIFAPLRSLAEHDEGKSYERDLSYMDVGGEGVYEVPVGPVHAGIIEPGHFRLSCMGERILNLEIRLGFLHRGVEKRLTEVPLTKTRFIAEAVASDTAAANAIASAQAIESLAGLVVPEKAVCLRALALEIERLSMHVCDLGGMAADLGCGAISAAFSRLRGSVFRLGELLSGSRFLRAYILPGGVARDADRYLAEFARTLKPLRKELNVVIDSFISDAMVLERLDGVGVLSPAFAKEFGLVGVAGRASAVSYDVRKVFQNKILPEPRIRFESAGDALSRTKIRVFEIGTSLDLIEQLLASLPSGPIAVAAPELLVPDSIAVGIVEAFRGELIHMISTDNKGRIKRYAVKDPSLNNWTGLAIAVRNNFLADFPVCNKSFGLSYSGHDL
ncbi:MAG: NADH-quinone oxidoreductase subunit C [Candidatus Obscuribacterales bacterium]|nr:NADH-quinone oxidoreductase subunit C [Candidatus Obscuribacterales bacterium]